MKYLNIMTYPRPWDRVTHPLVIHIEIDPQNFDQLERRVADQTQARVIGHDESDHGLIVVHIACTNDDAKRRIERRWS
jgi:hypothetical protein